MAGKSIQGSGVFLDQQHPDDVLLVEGYGEGGFRLMGRRFEGGVIVLPGGVYPIEATDIASLTLADFGKALNADPKIDLVLIGTGARMSLVPSALRAKLDAAGIGHDIMDTGAAARTYNVLLLEERRVAALLLPVD
ncbi:Mth938-like domain-containing protein [Pseudokordiimonas caeni]|uniref:Mth938-like domain-containing protein n=1 Tax=Pseudokordiimonas caeni TaxID=2997908 RepID=UPI002810B23C|nr:MTH938/NDUFAF3 family protein [Pseudokordiimonas caeni]